MKNKRKRKIWPGTKLGGMPVDSIPDNCGLTIKVGAVDYLVPSVLEYMETIDKITRANLLTLPEFLATLSPVYKPFIQRAARGEKICTARPSMEEFTERLSKAFEEFKKL